MSTKTHSYLIVFFISFTALSFAQLPNYVPTSNLVAWYGFNGNASDLSGNNHHGTAQNGVALTSDRFSNSNSAYHFDGMDDRILINQNFFDNGWTDLSISFWMNLDNINNSNNINNNNPTFNTSPHNGLDMGCNWGSTGKYSLWVGNGAPSTSWNVLFNSTSAQAAVTGTWKMITIIKRDSIYSFYVNGNLDNTWTGSQRVQSYLYKFYIGGTDPLTANETFNGTLDDFGIWNRALTTCEISELYAAALLPNISVSSSNDPLCIGQSAILTASGANAYSWNTSATSSTISVSPVTTTTYTVTGSDTLTGCSSTITLVEQVNECTTGIFEHMAARAVKVYPNPGNGEFFIEAEQELTLQITNELGQPVGPASCSLQNGYKCTISGLSNGVYFLYASGADGVFKQKIIVLK